MFENYLNNIDEFVKVCEQRKPTLAECTNVRSDVLALKSLVIRMRESAQQSIKSDGLPVTVSAASSAE